MVRLIRDRGLEGGAQQGVFVGTQAAEQEVTTQHEFVRRQFRELSLAKRKRHRLEEGAAGASNGRHHTRGDLVLEIEEARGSERTIESLRPDVGSGVGVDQAGAHPDGVARPPHAAIYDVPRVRVFRGTDGEGLESRQSGADVLGETARQAGALLVAAVAGEWMDRDDVVAIHRGC